MHKENRPRPKQVMTDGWLYTQRHTMGKKQLPEKLKKIQHAVSFHSNICLPYYLEIIIHIKYFPRYIVILGLTLLKFRLH